jgi:cysteine synthase A
MKIYGAEVKLCESVPFTDQGHYFHVAEKLGEQDGFFFPNQFENLNNGDSHFETTGPEIFDALNGKVEGFICSAGTGGTISGISRYLKSKNSETKAFLCDPCGSGLFDYVTKDKANQYQEESLPNTTFIRRSEGSSVTEGIGIGRLTANFGSAKLDGAVFCTDIEAVEMAYYLLRNDGINVGPSAALNVCGAVKLARQLPEGSNVVTILCDGGARYSSKLFNEEWLKEKGLVPTQSGDDIGFVL